MRCPSCATDVPDARFCNRCGGLLHRRSGGGRPDTPPSDATGPASDDAEGDTLTGPSSRGRRAVAVLAAATLATAVVVVATAGNPYRDVATRVDVPTAPPTPLTAAPGPATQAPDDPGGGTVLCSDLSEHRVPRWTLDDAEVGDVIDLHGTPCIVTGIDG